MGLALGFAVCFLIPIVIIFLVCVGLVILGIKISENHRAASIVMIVFGILGICVTSVPGYYLFTLIWDLVTYSG